MIGDVTPEQAIAEVGRTLGSLPKRAEPKAVPASSPTIRPPSGTGGPPVSLHHKGRKDQAIAYLEWPTTDFYADRHEAHVLVLTADVLQNRLLDRVRIREGVSYAPTSDAYAASEEIGFGYLQVTAEVPPARIDTFFSDVGEIVGDLCAQPPSADELLRARAPRIESETRSRQTLAYWTSYIGDLQADPREVESIRVKIPDFQSVTPAELSAACRKYLTPDRAWKLTVTPAAP